MELRRTKPVLWVALILGLAAIVLGAMALWRTFGGGGPSTGSPTEGTPGTASSTAAAEPGSERDPAATLPGEGPSVRVRP